MAVAPSVAAAQCPEGAQCGRLTVALDHTGRHRRDATAGVRRMPATGTRTGTIVFLSGGPGQAALPLTTGVASLIERPAREP